LLQRHSGAEVAEVGQSAGAFRGDELVALPCSRLILLIWIVVSRVFGVQEANSAEFSP
jgi:hypothetical protein